MHKIISSIAFVFASTAGATKYSCNPLLDVAVIPRTKLMRVSFDQVSAKITAKALNAGAVLTRAGRDEVLLIDAVAAQTNVDVFVKSLIEDAESAHAVAWRAELSLRITAYASFGTKIDDLATAVQKDGVIDGVRDAFFTRSFMLNGRRVMLASLRAPSSVSAAAAPLPRPIPADSPRARQAPDDAWFTLPPLNGHPRYMVWAVEGVSTPANASSRAVYTAKITSRMFEKSLVPLADAKRNITNSNLVFIPFFSLQYMNTENDPGAKLFEARFEERPGHQAVRIVRQYDALPVDIVINSAEFVRDHLEPSKRMRLEKGNFEVYVPITIWHTEIDQTTPEDAIEESLQEAFKANLTLVDQLREMPAGGRLTSMTAPEPADEKVARKKRTMAPFSMIFGKDGQGRVYLLSWIRKTQI